MKPSKKMTSDKQMVIIFRLHGNAFKSLKSCSCMAALKSSVKCFRFVHLLANSCSNWAVISSMGSSMYSRWVLKRCDNKYMKWSMWRMCNASRYSVRSLSERHSFGFWAKLRQILHTRAQCSISFGLKKENMWSRIFSGNAFISFF